MTLRIGDARSILQQNLLTGSPSLEELRVLVYGEKKVGKSTFASRFPTPLFLNLESGIASVRSMGDGSTGSDLLQVPITQWKGSDDSLMSWIQFLCKPESQELGIETVVLDGIHEAYLMLRNEVLDKHNVTDENEGVLSYGKGGRLILGEWHRWFNLVKSLPYQLVITAHDQTKKFTHAGVEYDQKIPLIDGHKDGRAWDIMKPSIDIVVYATKKQTKEGTKHLMYTKGTQTYEAGDPTSDGRLPNGKNLSYQLFEKAYNSNN